MNDFASSIVVSVSANSALNDNATATVQWYSFMLGLHNSLYY